MKRSTRAMKYFIIKSSHIKYIIAILTIIGTSKLAAQTGPGGVGTADGSSNLVLWLDADAEAGVNGAVSTSWNDQSGFGHNFNAGNGAVFNANAQNGVSTFGFDGASNYFEVPFSGALNPAQFTIFSASNVNSSGSYKALISSRDASPTAGYILYARPTTNNWEFWTGIGVGWGQVGNTSSTSGTWSSQTLSYQAGANGQQLSINNQVTATGSFSMSQNTVRPTRVGAGQNESTPSFYFNGDVGEVIMFNNVLNSAQTIIINNYLSAKYNFVNAANDLYTMDDLGNGDFDYDVVGIGRADASNMHTVAMSSRVLQIQNASSLDIDGEYLFWGHDNADATTWTTTEAPYAGVDVQRIAREWRLNEVGGDVGTVDFVIDPAALPALPGGFSSYALLVDSDGDFSDATPYLMTLSGANYTITGMDIANGDYVTIAAINPVIDHVLIESNGPESVTTLTIEVSQNFIASTDVSVSYATADGAALAAQPDYTAVVGGILTIPAGTTTITYSLAVIDDAAIESNEDFSITLSAPSAGVNLGANATHTYTINDNDNATKVFFSSALSNATEAFTGADIQVRLNIPAATTASVDYTIIGGTATGGGIDYTLLASGTITFQAPTPNDFRQFLPIGIIDDLMKEADETIIIRLSNPVNCNLDDGTLGFVEHTFTITDNDPDPTIQFNTTASTGNESVSPVDFQVDLSVISGSDTDITYTVTGGSAIGGGVDYTLLGSGVLTIPAGSLTGNISADIILDGIEEFDETIEISLSLPVNAILGANAVHTYTITDNSANLGHLGPGGVGNVDGTSSLVLWLDANRETGGGSWSDQSGFGNDFTAGTGATFNTGARNGFSTFGFDGGSNYFETAAYNATLNPSAFTVFSASQVNNVGSYKALISSRDNSPTAGYILYAVPSSANWEFWTGISSTWDKVGNTTSTAGTWSSQTSSYQSGTNAQQLYVDNSLNAQGTSTMVINSATPTRVGAGRNEAAADFYFNGDIGEVIMYSAVLNAARRTIVNNYLAAKYNFALTTNDFYTMDDPGNGDFDYEVAGIGRDNVGGFHVDAQGTGMVRVNGPTDLNNGEYLFWGHDNGSFDMANTTDIPVGINNRLNRIWRFDETGDVGSVSLSFDVSAFSINDSNELVLLVDSDDGLMVNSIEVAITSYAGGIATFNVNVVAGNWYTIASRTADNTLPVELISFTAKEENNTIALGWKTASEIDNDFFSVERSSNGVDFFEIGQVEGNGTTNELQVYDFVDKSPLNGVSYYRLRQVDYDGAFEYSNVADVSIALANFAFNVYPNPIENNRAIIEMLNVGEGDASIRVYNSVGKVVLNKTVVLNPNQSLKYDLEFERNIPTGIYIVEVRSGQNRYIRKVVIQ